MKRIRVDFLIVGAGLAGSVTGFLLKKAGAGWMQRQRINSAAACCLKRRLCSLQRYLAKAAWMHCGLCGSNTGTGMPGVKSSGRRMYFTPYPANVWTITAWNGICKWAERCRTGRRYAGLMTAPVLPNVPTFAQERRSKLNLAASLERTEPCRQCGIAMEGVVPSLSQDSVFEYLPREVGYSWYIPQGENAVAGCISYPGNAAICRKGMNSLCRGLQIEAPRSVRGAAIPMGGDILLEYGSRASFVGDAAGLIEGWSGAGIEQAVISARLLSESLLNGNSYTEAMKPQTDYIARLAQATKKSLFMYRFFIMRKGKPAKPFAAEKTR